ncbi:AsnC family transcriptional regulator [Patescibacteria group bacterium]|nr:AsnC family transcriptional regulator [Patescibacteria group bacterium]
MQKNTLLSLKPIKKFIKGVGKDVIKYFGKDKGCIIGLEDDGVFYGEGLYEWLSQKKKNVTFTTMDDYGKGLEQEKVKGRKVLLVDNDIVTGKAYRIVMKFMREKKERLEIKDIKFAVLCDRMKVADFSVEDYPAPTSWSLRALDEIDLEVIRSLSEDGRKSFVDIAKKTGLTPVGVKNRVEKLIKHDILKIRALLNIEKFYSVSANIGIEAPPDIISKLIRKFENCPLVYNLVRVSSGQHNLIIGILAPNLKRINDFAKKQIRSEPKIRDIHVNFGEIPLIPKGHLPPNLSDISKKCLCEEKCNECEHFL